MSVGNGAGEVSARVGEVALGTGEIAAGLVNLFALRVELRL